MAQRTEADINLGLGTVLRRFRSDLDMSQHELALLLGVSQTTVSMIESGARPIQAAEIWNWSEKIAALHPLSAKEIRREFYEGPFLAGWAARESNPEPTDSASVALVSIAYPEWGVNSTRNGESQPLLKRVA